MLKTIVHTVHREKEKRLHNGTNIQTMEKRFFQTQNIHKTLITRTYPCTNTLAPPHFSKGRHTTPPIPPSPRQHLQTGEARHNPITETKAPFQKKNTEKNRPGINQTSARWSR